MGFKGWLFSKRHRSLVLDSRGVTLTEVLISSALFGVLALGVADLSSQNGLFAGRAQNEAQLSEDIHEFSEALDLHLSSATSITACNCGADCLFPSPPAAPPASANCPGADCENLLVFDTEDSTDPGIEASGPNCEFGTANPFPGAAAPDGYVFRGCKKRMRLRYVPPTQAPPSGTGRQGELFLETLNRATGEFAMAASLRGVTGLNCGYPRFSAISGATNANSGQFKIGLRTKAPLRRRPPASDEFEGWHPNDPRFARGLHRELSKDIELPNLSAKGVHFGKTVSYLKCVRDTDVPNTSSSGNCCSGYRFANGACMPIGACLPRGATPSNTDPALGFAECCSHQLLNDSTCL